MKSISLTNSKSRICCGIVFTIVSLIFLTNFSTPVWAAASFATPQPYVVGTTPKALSSGDFNGDSKSDLVVVNYGSNNVSVLFGNGDGTLQAAVNYPVGNAPCAIKVSDINNDGHDDLIVANSGDNSVSILFGNPDGTFQAAVNYAVGAAPSSLDVNDINADGWQDIVVSSTSGNSVIVLLNNGDSTFAAPVSYSLTAPKGLKLEDFNNDGNYDIAVVFSGGVGILLGNGDGTFQPAVSSSAGTTPVSLIAYDYNGDGYTDLIVVNSGSNNTSILLNNGDGTFQPPVNYAVGTGPSSVVHNDFDSNGTDDLVVTNTGSNTISLLHGNVDGTFQAAVSLPAGVGPVAVISPDLNPDSYRDVVVIDANSLLVFLNTTGAASTPTATTGVASSVTTTTATLNGTVNDNGADSTTSFEYGLTSGYGSAASGASVSSGTGSTAVSASISGLVCNTTYHFRVSGQNIAGTASGLDASFTTSSCPAGGSSGYNWTATGGTNNTIYRTSPDGTKVPLASLPAAQSSYTDNSALLPNTIYTYSVRADDAGAYLQPYTVRTPLYNGWNIIGVPFNTTGIAASTLFGNPVGPVYEWIPTGSTDPDNSGGYVIVPTLTPGKGYFVSSNNSSTMLTYAGAANPATVDVTLKPGYTMISNTLTANRTNIGTAWLIDGFPLGDAIAPSVAFPTPVISGAVYWWNGITYDSWSILGVNPTIEPWKAYWILNLDTVDHTLTIQ